MLLYSVAYMGNMIFTYSLNPSHRPIFIFTFNHQSACMVYLSSRYRDTGNSALRGRPTRDAHRPERTWGGPRCFEIFGKCQCLISPDSRQMSRHDMTPTVPDPWQMSRHVATFGQTGQIFRSARSARGRETHFRCKKCAKV